MRAATLLLASFVMAPVASRADLHEGLHAHRSQDYVKAAQELTPLAQLGEPLAQYTLATMRLKGEGGPRDLVEGVGWLMAAESHGSREAAQALRDIDGTLDESQRAKAREYAAPFGADALVGFLLPGPRVSLPVFDTWPRVITWTSELENVDYAFKGQAIGFGWLEVVILVDVEGSVREVLSIDVVPDTVDVAKLTALGRSIKLRPALDAGRPVAVWSKLMFQRSFAPSVDARRTGTSWRFVAKFQDAAARGDPVAQHRYARIGANVPFLELPRNDWIAALERSAEVGRYPPALYHMQTHPAVAGKEKSKPPPRVWLQRAAQAGFGPAQLRMALEAWAERTDASRGYAHQWLAAADADDYVPARKYLAALLLESDPSEADRARALKLIDVVIASAQYDADPDAWQIRATALATMGDWGAAIEAQKEAMALAEDCAWPLDRLKARLGAFEARSALAGDLVALPEATWP